MARPRRVSVRGRGADLFFGDLSTDDSDAQQVEEAELEEQNQDELDESRVAETPANTVPEQDSKHARNGAVATIGPQPAELISGAILDAIWRDVNEQATVTNAFRYTHDELEQLSDAIYELGKEHGIRVTKQEVARLGLNAVLTDYQIRGTQSLLSEFIARRKDVGR